MPAHNLQIIISVLQTALTPAFLLVALGSMLNLFAGRLSRIVDRSRILQDRHKSTLGEEHQILVDELRLLEKRMNVVSRSILLGVLAAATVCLMIGLLFFMGLAHYSIATAIVASFIIALVLMAGSLFLFVYEVLLATRNIRVRDEYLELPRKVK